MKQAFRLLGIAIAIAAGVYFVRHAIGAFGALQASSLSPGRLLGALVVMLPAYLVAVPLASVMWGALLRAMGVVLPPARAYAIVAVTQFAKYLPGNVAHHVGRVVVARPFGGDVARLSLSLVYENLLTALAAAHLTALLVVLRPVPALEPYLPTAWRPWLLLAITLGAAAGFLMLGLLVAKVQQWRGAPEGPKAAVRPPGPATLLGAYAVAVTSFLVVGLGFTAMAPVVSPGVGFPYLSLCGAFAAAWVIGLLVPGAPAGLGIREGVLLVLLGETMATGDAVMVIAILRVATTLGDLIHFLAGSAMMRRGRGPGSGRDGPLPLR